MALKDLNTFNDLAQEWGGVTGRTVRRWFQRWGAKFNLKVKRPSGKLMFVERTEAERFWKLVGAMWKEEEEQAEIAPVKPRKQTPKKRKR